MTPSDLILYSVKNTPPKVRYAPFLGKVMEIHHWEVIVNYLMTPAEEEVCFDWLLSKGYISLFPGNRTVLITKVVKEYTGNAPVTFSD